jgi:hypothetical protein
MSGGGYTLLESALAVARSRSSWNSWLEQAEKPASDHEEAKIERAASMAAAIVNSNQFLAAAGVRVLPQGSYHNNTNTRNEADMDHRVQMAGIRIIYGDGVDPVTTYSQNYVPLERTLEDTASLVRAYLARDLIDKFKQDNVDVSGNKAITVTGLDGSRADCDLVPAFHFHLFQSYNGTPYKIEGVAIPGKDGSWTENFPKQHHDNGIAKRTRTSHRFKRNVRMLKRLNYELADNGDIDRRLPSFFIECLVYAVEDEHFCIDADDRFLRLLRILWRLEVLLGTSDWCERATEVNEIKFLFRPNQAWTLAQAQNFVTAALNRMTR